MIVSKFYTYIGAALSVNFIVVLTSSSRVIELDVFDFL